MKGMTLIVKTVTRWITGFIFLYGLYIVAYGHLTPGGGFAGGVILACAYILLTLAYGKERAQQNLNVNVASALDSVGALAFLLLALLGVLAAGTFFLNVIQKQFPGKPFNIFNAGIIPLCNIAIAVKVCVSLFLVFLILASVRIALRGPERSFDSDEEE